MPSASLTPRPPFGGFLLSLSRRHPRCPRRVATPEHRPAPAPIGAPRLELLPDSCKPRLLPGRILRYLRLVDKNRLHAVWSTDFGPARPYIRWLFLCAGLSGERLLRPHCGAGVPPAKNGAIVVQASPPAENGTIVVHASPPAENGAIVVQASPPAENGRSAQSPNSLNCFSTRSIVSFVNQ